MSDSNEEIVLILSPEVEQDLADNGIDLPKYLTTQGHNVKAELRENPIASAGGGATRDVVTILTVVAGGLLSITPLILGIINSITHRPVVISNKDYKALLDGDGKVVRDNEGNPIYKEVIKNELVTPNSQTRSDTVKANLGIMEISYDSKSGA